MKWRHVRVAFLALLIFSALITIMPATVFAASVGNTAPYPPNSNPVNGSHVFFIRKNPDAGKQKDIKFSAYLPAGANIANARIQLSPGSNPSAPNVCTVNTRPNGQVVNGVTVNNNQYIRVSITEPTTGASRAYYVSAANACSQINQLNQTGANQGPNNYLYAQYAFPGVTSPPIAVESKTNMLRFDVVIEYGTPTPNDAGGIRIVSSIPTNPNALISPGTNGFAFPTVGDWDDIDPAIPGNPKGPQNLIVPFGLCENNNTPQTKRIGLYDADNGPNSAFVPSVVNFKVRDLTTNSWVTFNSGSAVLASFNASRDTVIPDNGTNDEYTSAQFEMIPSHYYEMHVRDISLRNTIDINIPNGSQSIWGDPNVCQGPPPPATSYNEVLVTSSVPGGGDVELGDSATFQRNANVTNFPTNPSQWGFNEEATRVAWNTNTAPVQTPYNANNAGATGQNAAAERQCQTGWAANCGTYVCDNGSTRLAATGCGAGVGGYRWRCAWNGKYDPATGWTGGQNAPTCGNIVQYQCRDASGNWANAYRDFGSRSGSPGCSDQWNCWAPSGRTNTYDPNYGAGYCRVFRCAYDANPANYFYSPPGNNADDQCDKRCSGGTGARAINWNPPGSLDDNCYIAPSFTVTCTWDNGVSQSENVYGNGIFCDDPPNNSITKTATALGPQLCAVTTASASGWSSPPPGKGINGNVNFMRATWAIITSNASGCYTVVSKPYLRVYNGDVNATAIMPNATGACNLSTPSGAIKAFNRGNSLRPDGVQEQYRGAGVQIAALAGSTITGFASRATNINSPFVPKVLSFSNSGSTAADSAYGGGYTGPRYCIPNYWAEAAVSGVPVSGLIDTNPMATPPASGTLVQYVNGDAYITTDISYGDASYAADQFPAYRLVVTGNIYIKNTVARLDGAYIARGTIYTCADAAAPPSVSLVADSCGTQLLVNGGFVANYVKLLRTTTTMRASNVNQQRSTDTQAAEKFVFSPESWLRIFTPIGPNNQPDGYDAVNTLPPIL